MTYSELLKIAQNYSPCLDFPCDATVIANNLQLRLKNSIECKRDFSNSPENPLNSTYAIYAIFNGEYTIYYDEKQPYKNFHIAHEIAHHLLNHRNDGDVQHHDANLLAAMLIAPPKQIIKHHIKNATDLSLKCAIPSEVATEYWIEFKSNSKCMFSRKTACLAITGVVIALILSISTFKNDSNISDKDVSTPTPIITPSPTPYIAPTADSNDTEQITYVYITKYGEKYHKDDCSHIQGSENILHITMQQAVDMGYEPCKDCF